jgi:hypothetical protein
MAKKKSYEFRFAHIEIGDLGTAVILGETKAKNKHGRRAVKPPRPTRSQARRCNIDAQSNPVASERKRSHAECGRREEACGAIGCRVVCRGRRNRGDVIEKRRCGLPIRIGQSAKYRAVLGIKKCIGPQI